MAITTLALILIESAASAHGGIKLMGTHWRRQRTFWPWLVLFLLFLVRGGDSVTCHAQTLAPRHIANAHSEGGVPSFVGPVSFAPDGKMLVILEGWDSLFLWEVATQKMRATFKWPAPTGVRHITHAPNGRQLAIAGEATFQVGTIRVYDPFEGTLRELLRHSTSICSLASSPDGKTLAFGDNAGMVKLVDVATGRFIGSLSGKGYIQVLQFSPDGTVLAGNSGSITKPVFGELRLWDVAHQRLRWRLPYEDLAPGAIAFSPDGGLLATDGGGSSDEILLLDARSRQEQRRWRAGIRGVNALVFSPDGQVLIAGGGQLDGGLLGKGFGSVKFFDVASGKALFMLATLHKDAVQHLAVSPNGRLLALSCYGSPAAEVWEMPASGVEQSRKQETGESKR